MMFNTYQHAKLNLWAAMIARMNSYAFSAWPRVLGPLHFWEA